MPMSLRVGSTLACTAYLCLQLPSYARAACSAPTERHVIKFYEYQGAQNNEGFTNFSVFRKVIDEDIRKINDASEIVLSKIATEPSGDKDSKYARGQLDPTVSYQVLHSDPRLLELMDGRLQKSAQSPLYIVHSDIYFISKSGPGLIQPVSEDFLLDTSKYEDTRNIHLSATYYALAVDAAGRSCQREAINLLSHAIETLIDIPFTSGGAQTLRSLIISEQQVLGMPP